jgi:hydrogenase maturation protease
MPGESGQVHLRLFDMQMPISPSLSSKPNNDCFRDGRLLILGVGNMLLKDEGVGVHVARKLQEIALPCNVEVMDGGTASLDTLLLAQDIEKLVVIDAFRAGKKPGTIYRMHLGAAEKDRLRQSLSKQECLKISLHQVGLLDALAVAERMNCAPSEIVVIGVEPGEVDYGLELTDEVKQRVPEVIGTVLKEIENDIYRE